MFFLLNNLFLVYECFVYMSAPGARVQKEHWIPWNGSHRWLWVTTSMLEAPSPGLLQERHVSLPLSTLQPFFPAAFPSPLLLCDGLLSNVLKFYIIIPLYISIKEKLMVYLSHWRNERYHLKLNMLKFCINLKWTSFSDKRQKQGHRLTLTLRKIHQ